MANVTTYDRNNHDVRRQKDRERFRTLIRFPVSINARVSKESVRKVKATIARQRTYVDKISSDYNKVFRFIRLTFV